MKKMLKLIGKPKKPEKWIDSINPLFLTQDCQKSLEFILPTIYKEISNKNSLKILQKISTQNLYKKIYYELESNKNNNKSNNTNKSNNSNNIDKELLLINSLAKSNWKILGLTQYTYFSFCKFNENLINSSNDPELNYKDPELNYKDPQINFNENFTKKKFISIFKKKPINLKIQIHKNPFRYLSQ